MPDYSPVFLPGLVITSVLDLTSDPVVAGDPLEIADSGTVGRAAAASAAYIGIAAHDCDPGLFLSVVAGKTVHQGPAEGGIAARDMVAPSAADGRQVTATTDPADAIGLAMTDAADGQLCRWIQR